MSEHCQSMGQKGSCLCEVCGAIRGGLPLRPARHVLELTGVLVALAGFVGWAVALHTASAARQDFFGMCMDAMFGLDVPFQLYVVGFLGFYGFYLGLAGLGMALAGYFLRVRRIQRLYNQALCGKSKCPGQ